MLAEHRGRRAKEPFLATVRLMKVPIVSRFAALAVLPLLLTACTSSSAHTSQQGPTGSPASSSAGPHAVAREIQPNCLPTELRLALTWHRDPSGSLSGDLRATNPGTTACGLLVKPDVQPLGLDGKPLDTQFITTSEGLYGPNALRPGHSATSGISWGGWCGKPVGPQVRVSWGEVAATVAVTGPRQPSCPTTKGAPTNMSSTWFSGLLAGR